MQTYFYGRGRIGSATLDGRNLTINWVSDYRPLGTDLIPDDTERNGGAFHDYTKGDPLGMEVWVWSTHGVPTSDEVSLFQLSNLDRTPDNRARRLGKVQLLRDWWRRSEASDGGMVMRWGFRVLAFDQQDLLQLVQLGEHHTLSFHPAQYELPAVEGKVTKRKGKKAEQQKLPMGAGEGGDWPGEEPGAQLDEAQQQEARREVSSNDKVQVNCTIVLESIDDAGDEGPGLLLQSGLLLQGEIDTALAWLVDAGFTVVGTDINDVSTTAVTPAGRAWLNARTVATAQADQIARDAAEEGDTDPDGQRFLAQLDGARCAADLASGKSGARVIDTAARDTVFLAVADALASAENDGQASVNIADVLEGRLGGEVAGHARRLCLTVATLLAECESELIDADLLTPFEGRVDFTVRGLAEIARMPGATVPGMPKSLRRPSNGEIAERRLAIWLGDELRAKGDDGVSFGALRLMVDKHQEGELVGQLHIERAMGVLQSGELVSPKGRSKKLWTVNTLTDEAWATARTFVQEMADSLDD